MQESALQSTVQQFVFEKFKNELATPIVYHNYSHTLNVVEAVKEICIGENISESESEIVILAAWFHDLGFVENFNKHEDISNRMAQDFLESKNYDSANIDRILSLIEATKMPQNPKSHLAKILCDADLFHLGSENFKEKSNLLRNEWENTCNQVYSDIEWLEKNEFFLKNHHYFTDYAFNKLDAQKTQNWLKTKKDLEKTITKQTDAQLKLKLKEEDLQRKIDKENRPDRGIETMYRVTLRNHIKLSDIADTKANILLSVSAIILSIALSSLFPKLDKPDNYYLIYPTLLFLLITVVTMIFSILSTRPKVTTGEFTEEDVKNKKVNLLFFGNFHKMPLEKFQNGMTELMKDRDYLYKSLMKDLYFLGIVLDKKYKLLRVAYTIFMIGIILSVIAFVVAFLLMKSHGKV